MGCLEIVAIIGGLFLYFNFETDLFSSFFYIIIFSLFVGFIYNILEKKFSYKDFKNENEEKEIENSINLVSVFIAVALSSIFKNIWCFLIPIFVGLVIVSPLLKYFLRREKAKEYYNNQKYIKQEEKLYDEKENLLDRIDEMTGQEFETLLIKKLLPSDGYININGTSYTGDYGVDIIAEKNGIKCAIQCKRFNNKVSVSAIQEIVAGRRHYKCDKAIVITNNYYTKNAQELAFDNKVELLDRDNIIQMIKNLSANDE